MLTHENSFAESKRARGQTGRARYSDRQRKFWRTFQRDGIGANERAQRHCNDRRCQIALVGAARNREHTSQVVVQGTALIVRIIGTVLVLFAILMGVMMMHVPDPAALGRVGSNILLVLECILDMDADQWHDTRRLGK
jgi:hypothetical protein